MISRILFLLAFASMSAGAYAVDVYKWVDEKGRVQYGESVPAKYKKIAVKVDVTTPAPTAAQRQEAEARATKDKTTAGASSTASDQKASKPPRPAAATTASKAAQCEAEKKKYKESEACFAPYRSNSGTINPEAFQHCVEVKEPTC